MIRTAGANGYGYGYGYGYGNRTPARWRSGSARMAGDVLLRSPAPTAGPDPMTDDVAPMPTELVTDRLALRLRDPGDAGWSLALHAERDRPVISTLAESQARLAGQAADAERHGFGFYAIRCRPVASTAGGDGAGAPHPPGTGTAGRRREPMPIGYCGLLIGRATLAEPEIGYELFRHAHGLGYATEAAGVVLDAAFASGRRRVWATVGSWNAASLRVLDKVGFRRTRTTTEDVGEVVWLVAER